MSYEDMLNDIKKNAIKSVYLCYGTEKYLQDWLINELKIKYIDKKFESLNYMYLDGKEITIDEIHNACETLPFMSDKKIVIVNDFFDGRKDISRELEEEMAEYILKLNNKTCLVFLSNSEKMPKGPIAKSIKKVGRIIELKRIKGEALNKWILHVFKKNNKTISKNNIFYLQQNSSYLEYRSEKTLYDLENEIEKICNYVGDRKEVTEDDINKVLVKSIEGDIFKLVDGIGQKRCDVALNVLNEMILENEPLQLILFMIIRQFRLIYKAKLLDNKGYSQGDISRKLSVNSFIAKKIISQGRNFSIDELENALEKSLIVEENIKQGYMDAKLAVEMLIIQFASK